MNYPLLLYFGPQWEGSTSQQRLRAFSSLNKLRTLGLDNGAKVIKPSNLWRRVRWRLGLPVDVNEENRRLIEAVDANRPDFVLVDNSKVIIKSTLSRLRQLGTKRLVYYSPDDIVARHNLSWTLRRTLPLWDIVFTTKTFNVPELRAIGVKSPTLVGKAYDKDLHNPMSVSRVGEEYEKFDVVFIGTFEAERCNSINALAEAGFSIIVFGADLGNWFGQRLHPTVVLRPSVFGAEYVRAWHMGKVALCFLRKINRDRITQRTMEIAAIGRPMVAERTDEHDAHFAEGTEYLGFTFDQQLVDAVGWLLHDEAFRRSLANAARMRCLGSGYSSVDRAREMAAAIQNYPAGTY